MPAELSIERKRMSTDDRLDERMLSYDASIALLLENLHKHEKLDVSKIANEKLQTITAHYTNKIFYAPTVKEKRELFEEQLTLKSHYIAKQTGKKTGGIFKAIKRAEILHALKAGTTTKPNIVNITIGNASIKLTDTPITELTKAQKNEFRAILNKQTGAPKWFTQMPKWQQGYLHDQLTAAKGEKGEIDFSKFCGLIPSSLRDMPGLANYSQHEFSITINGITHSSTRFRSSILSPIDLYQAKKVQADIDRLAELNIEQLIENNLANVKQDFGNKWNIDSTYYSPPILLQTLVSPGKLMTAAGKVAPDNDTRNVKEKNSAVANLLDKYPNLIPTNNAINALRKGTAYKFSSDSKGDRYRAGTDFADKFNLFFTIAIEPKLANKNFLSDDLISALKVLSKQKGNAQGKSNSVLALESIKATIDKINSPDFNENNFKPPLTPQQLTDFKQITQVLYDYFTITKLQPKQNLEMRSLFLSSLEQMATTLMGGIAYGSCKSGKDRKGLEILHTDAMQIYFHTYAKIPNINDKGKDRQNFVDIYATLFKSRHQQQTAAFNAPGVDAMKSIKGVLPKDTYNAINLATLDGYNMLERDSEIATLNKPGKSDLSANKLDKLLIEISEPTPESELDPKPEPKPEPKAEPKPTNPSLINDIILKEYSHRDELNYSGKDLTDAGQYLLENQFHYTKNESSFQYLRADNQEKGQTAAELEKDEIVTAKTMIKHAYALNWQPLLTGSSRLVIIAYAYAQANNEIDASKQMPIAKNLEMSTLSGSNKGLYDKLLTQFKTEMQNESKLLVSPAPSSSSMLAAVRKKDDADNKPDNSPSPKR